MHTEKCTCKLAVDCGNSSSILTARSWAQRLKHTGLALQSEMSRVKKKMCSLIKSSHSVLLQAREPVCLCILEWFWVLLLEHMLQLIELLTSLGLWIHPFTRCAVLWIPSTTRSLGFLAVSSIPPADSGVITAGRHWARALPLASISFVMILDKHHHSLLISHLYYVSDQKNQTSRKGEKYIPATKAFGYLQIVARNGNQSTPFPSESRDCLMFSAGIIC